MLLPKQIWKEIPNYEGKYQVSNTGRVRSLNYNRTGKTKVMKQGKDKDGYKNIILHKNGKYKIYYIHRLVALAFIPNPDNLPQVNHKDEDKTNNTVWNLEWCTPEYNTNYGTRNKRTSEANKGKSKGKGKNNPKAKPVLMFTLDGKFIRMFNCVVDANEYLGKDRHSTNISMCATNKSKTAWGYIWKYEEDCK